MNANSDKEGLAFAYLLKDMITAARTDVRICFSGTSMVSFLNTLRKLKPNGYQLFTNNQYVLLGHEVSPMWGTHIADGIKGALVRTDLSSPLSSSSLTTELILKTIQNERDLLNVRPAIIHQLLSKFKNRSPTMPAEDVDTKLSKCMGEIIMKMEEESTPDFMLALESLQHNPKFLKTLFLLAKGDTLVTDLFTKANSNDEKFAALLCGLNDFPRDSRPKLLPPYAHARISSWLKTESTLSI